MHDAFVREPRWAGVRFIKGLLDGPPASALQLSEADGDFGADDLMGTPIEELVPNYSILEDIRHYYQYPVEDAYFGYASRGCVRKCRFCGVPTLEGPQREMPPLTQWVSGIKATHGEKKDLVLMDNNVTASARYKDIIAEILDLGFERGATLTRLGSRTKMKRRVDFNQGVDARILAKSPMYLQEMAKTCISPLRIAFDHIGVRKTYETAVRMAADNGITSLSNYMLYNFMDTPEDLYQRMRLNINLNERLGIRIWSFPMRYQPVTLKDRSHVGPRWTRYQLRSFQIMLQATKGIVSGSPEFFARAYGNSVEEFLHLLSLPHGFIFNRSHYEIGGQGADLKSKYLNLRRAMTEAQQDELLHRLDGNTSAMRLPRESYRLIVSRGDVDPMVREALAYHAIDTKDRLLASEVTDLFRPLGSNPIMPDEEEIVEDAGLFEQNDLASHSRGITAQADD